MQKLMLSVMYDLRLTKMSANVSWAWRWFSGADRDHEMIDSKRKLKKEKNKKQIYSESIEVYHMIQWVFCPVSLKVASFYHKIVTVEVIL